VTFETIQGIQSLSPKAHPLGWSLVQTHGWSHLGLLSKGDTWFRGAHVYAYFDRLVDDGFFEDFDSVLFFGAGPCGYAAAAYSVVAPGARVLAIQPQATLSPALAGWDRRFTEERRIDFTSRYGYAPDMLEAAARAYVVFDPMQAEDAMHAALYTRPNVTKLHARFMGASLQTDFLQTGVLPELIELAQTGRLTPARFARCLRLRRDHAGYLRRLLAQAETRGGEGLIAMLCHHVTAKMPAPRFAKRLESLGHKAQ
jgi:hypothetical protein